MAWMTRWQSPSKHTWKSINSFTKITTLQAASASACSTDWGLYIFWLSAPMMLPELSRTTTPSPANSLLSKKAASKLTYPPSAGGDHLTWGARCTGFRGCWWISKNSTTSSFALRPISCRGQVWETAPPARFMIRMLGQTHVNGWSRVIASQNGGSTDYIFPLRFGVLQWSHHLFNYWKNKKTIIEKEFLILLIWNWIYIDHMKITWLWS